MIKTKINNLEKKRIKIINFSKDIIIKNGWNKNLFKKISQEKKLNLSEIHVLFPNGYKDMLLFTLHNLNYNFEKKFSYSKIKNLPLHKKIKKIIIDKINFINLEKEFYKKIFYHLLLPNNYRMLTSQIYRSADLMWYIAKDKSTDFNYYSKRMILSCIYSSTLFYFFNNNNLEGTEKYLDKMLINVSQIPKLKKNFISLMQPLSSFSKFFSKHSY